MRRWTPQNPHVRSAVSTWKQAAGVALHVREREKRIGPCRAPSMQLGLLIMTLAGGGDDDDVDEATIGGVKTK